MTAQDRDAWWKRQFARLLAQEEAGHEPKLLDGRWLLLASRTWPDKRWRVTFDVPDHIYPVLDDADVRSRDSRYAANQRRDAKRWIGV